MKSLRTLLFTLICLTFSKSCFAQAPQFDLAEYQQFLEQHIDMTTPEPFNKTMTAMNRTMDEIEKILERKGK